MMPCDIEMQKKRILDEYHKQRAVQEAKFTPEMQQKFLHTMTDISVNDVQAFPSHLLMRALPKVNKHLRYLREALNYWRLMQQVEPRPKFELVLLDFLFDPERERPVPRAEATMLLSSLVDLQEDFRDAVRRDFLSLVLQKCENVLGIAPPPLDFPVVTIKAPVPWKCAIQLARNRLDQVLMTCHPVLQAINMLWHELYHDLIIVNTKRAHSEIALDAAQLTGFIEKCCDIARQVGIVNCNSLIIAC